MRDVQVLGCRAGEIFDDPASAVLFEENSYECANPLLGATAPQREMYEVLERSGMAQCFGAYEGDVLRGFAFMLMAPSGHNGRRYATVESLFVTREARSSGLGDLVMGTMEDHAKQYGCEAIFYSAHVGSRLAKLLFLCSDRYTNTNHIFCRRLQ